MNRGRRLTLLFPVAFLGGCGFRLRGTSDWPPELSPIHVSGLDQREPLYLMLAQTLRAGGIEVVASPSPDVAELIVLTLRQQRRVLSVTAAARLSEYEVTRVLEAELRVPGMPERRPLGRLESSRVYLFDAASLLSRTDREEELARAIDRDLITLLQLRVRAVMDGTNVDQED